MVAACFGKVRVVERLLAGRADVERTSASGRCALCYACLGPPLMRQKAIILQRLIDAGARAGVPRAFETAALLGRVELLRVLMTAGALPIGQLVTIRLGSVSPTTPPPSPSQAYAVYEPSSSSNSPNAKQPFSTELGAAASSDPLVPLHPNLHLALAAVRGFDVDGYTCDVLAVRDPLRPGSVQTCRLRVCVPPEQLHLALHHVETESCHAILAAGQGFLDGAAGALAGAPSSLELPESPLASPPGACKPGACKPTPCSALGGPLGGVSLLHVDAVDTARHAEELPEGCLVRIQCRPEQWLRGKCARVHAWDARMRRYLILLPVPLEERVAILGMPHASAVPILVRPEHLELVDYHQHADADSCASSPCLSTCMRAGVSRHHES